MSTERRTKFIGGDFFMQAIQEALLPIVQKINAYLSDYILIILLVGTGLFFSIRTRFVQVRCFKEGRKRPSETFP